MLHFRCFRTGYAARRTTAKIPGARFVELDTANHLIPEDDPAWPRFLAEVTEILES
ncbi:MAG: hypothetical protein QF578_14375 [Alphaproteobacteria bacterium]|nr:hypothetical protein [Alphaproteobacteria bacterium]MDP6812277.1 hypothetical protein [Alphaproteobacteria bacterium]